MTATTKGARRTTVRRRAGRQHISDRRYYIQCGYRLSMAVITLIALFVVTHH